MPPPRILVDATTLRVGGGVQAGVTFLMAAASSNEFEWFVATSEKVDEHLTPEIRSAFSGYRTFQTATIPQKLLAGQKLRTWSREMNLALVYTIFGPAYWRPTQRHVQGFARGLLFAPQTAAETGRTWTSRLRDLVLNARQRRSFRLSDYLVAETETVKQLLVEHLDVPSGRVFVVPNTYNPTFAAGQATAPTPDHKDKPFVFFTPAWPYPHKNLRRQIEAAGQLKQDFGSNFSMVLTVDPASQEWQRLSGVAEGCGVADLVTTVGQLDRDQLLRQYQRCDAVMLMTLWECSTATYPEAFITRRPILTSDRPFARELCGDAALFADPLNSQQTASAMRRMIEYPKLRSQLVAAGEVAIEKTYTSPTRKFSAVVDILKEVAHSD